MSSGDLQTARGEGELAAELPGAVRALLRGVRLRLLVVVSLVAGAGLVLWGVGAMVGVTLIDYVFRLPYQLRLVALVALVVAGLGWFWRGVVMRWLRRPTDEQVAEMIEAVHPELEDRLASAVTFVKGAERETAFVRRTVEQAGEVARGISAGSVVSGRAARVGVLRAAGVVGLVMLVGWLSGAEYRAAAVARVLTPWDDRPWPKRVLIGESTVLPGRVAAGEKLDLRLTIGRGNSGSLQPKIVVMVDGREVRREVAQRREDGSFGMALDTRLAGDSVDGAKVTLVAVAGDDQRELGTVHVVPRLTMKSATAVVTAPVYARGGGRGAGGDEFDLLKQPAVMVEHSQVVFDLGFSKPLDAGTAVVVTPVEAGGGLPPVAWSVEGQRVVGRNTSDVLAGEAVDGRQGVTYRFRVTATDHHGLTNLATEELVFAVRGDGSPTVSMLAPGRAESRTADAVLPLVVQAEDDFGLAEAAVEVRNLGSKARWEWPLVVGGEDGGAKATAETDVQEQVIAGASGAGVSRKRVRMSRLQPLMMAGGEAQTLTPGDVLEVVARVRDNFEMNGERHAPVRSSAVRILIVSQEQLSAEVADNLRGAARQVQSLSRQQAAVQAETKQLLQELTDRGSVDPAAEKALARLAGTQGQLADQARQVAEQIGGQLRRLAENRSVDRELATAAQDAAAAMEAAAENSMPESRGRLAAAKASEEAGAQQQELEAANKAQQAAQQQLSRAVGRLGTVGSLEQAIASLQEMLSKQQELSQQTKEQGKQTVGRRPEQLTPKQREELAETAEKQQQLSRQTQQMVQQMEKQAQQLSSSDPAAAAAMRQAAQTAKQQQVGQNQSKAADAVWQNQQSAAQSAQRQAEAGLQMALAQVREAQKRKLEELSKKLAELAEQLDNLVRRQAGHNLDSIELGGVVAGEALKKGLEEKAARPVDAGKPQMERLSASQEQTERNTRSLASAAGENEGGGEIASALTNAAGRMERAVGLLRQGKVAEAYDPPQVQALAALEGARETLQKQQEETDQQAQEQKRQELIAQLKELRDEQEGLRAETGKVDAVGRDAQGNLLRPQRIAAGQLSTRQGELADRLGKVGEELGELNAVVFTWTAKEIATRMGGVKEKLAGADVGEGVQADQRRIVARLDGMLRSLDIKPPDPKDFEDRASAGGGGGSGGGGKKRLPSEAEMRLLKELQVAVNDETKAASEARAGGVDTKGVTRDISEQQRGLRNTLDQLVRAASRGEEELPGELPAEKLLPEEQAGAGGSAAAGGAGAAAGADVDGLDDDLLKADPDKAQSEEGQAMRRAGDRMGRSRQRLATADDAGEVTQVIQKKILEDLDEMIAQARENDRQQQQQQQQQQQKQQMAQPGQGESGGQTAGGGAPAAGQPSAGSEGAQDSRLTDGQEASVGQGGDIRQSAREWGGLSPRQRQAVIEGASDTVVEKYRAMVEDYYRALAEKTTEPR